MTSIFLCHFHVPLYLSEIQPGKIHFETEALELTELTNYPPHLPISKGRITAALNELLTIVISADIQYFINGVELRTTEELLRTRHDTYITWQYKVQIEYFKDNKRAMPRELPYASDFMSFSSSVHNTDYPANLYVMVHLPANESMNKLMSRCSH